MLLRHKAAHQICLLTAVVTYDVAIKLLAFYALPSGKPIHDCIACIVLRVNYFDLGGMAQSIIARYGIQSLMGGAIFKLLLTFSLMALAVLGRLTKLSVILSIIATSVTGVVLASLPYSVHEFDHHAIAKLSYVTGSALWMTIWDLTPFVTYRIGAFLIAAGGLSNTLSFAYPPYHAVDYLWSSPWHRLTSIGVFNIADLLLLGAYPTFAFAFITSAWKLLLRWRQPASVKRQ